MKWFNKNKFRPIVIPDVIKRCDEAIKDIDDIIARAKDNKLEYMLYKAKELTNANKKYINKRVKVRWVNSHGNDIETTCYFNCFCVREGHLCISGNIDTPEHKRSVFVRCWQDLPYDDFSNVKIEII